MKSKSWLAQKQGVIVLLILFFPVGLFLMWKNGVFSKRTRWIITALAMSPIVFGPLSNGGFTSKETLIAELTSTSFDGGSLKFNKDGTFVYDFESNKVSGKYRVAAANKWENESGYTGMRHLGWEILFSDVRNSEYWDSDNSMMLFYDWNHPNADKDFRLIGNSVYYPIEMHAACNGQRLVAEYW